MRYQPVDYSIDIQPQESGIFEDIQAIRQIGQARQARELAAQRKAEFEPLFEDLYNNYSTEKAARLNAQFPEYGEQFKTLLPLEGIQKKQALAQVAGINNAFKAGKAEVGLERLFSLAKGHRDRGEDVMADFYEGIRQDFIDSPDQAGVLLDQLNLFNNPEMAKQEADLLKTRADTGEAEAKTKLTQEQAKDLEKSRPVTLQKKKAQLLKTRAETTKLINEAKNTGLMTPKDRADFEIKLTNQYLKEAGDFEAIDRQYRNIDDASLTGVGGLTTVLSFMKTIDPTSVVSSSEKATAENAAGWPAALVNFWNKHFEAGKLSDEAIKQFKAEAKKIRDNAAAPALETRKRIKKQADGLGIDIGNVFNQSRIDELIDSELGDTTPTGEGTGVLKVGQTGVVKDPSGKNVVVKKIRD